MRVILDNVRCFDGKHSIPVRPLTLLVGENSAGKSTFLAACALLADKKFPTAPDFNAYPYMLGAYSTIATKGPGRKGQAASFSIGIEFKSDGIKRHLVATYGNKAGEVKLCQVNTAIGQDTVNVSIGDNEIIYDFNGKNFSIGNEQYSPYFQVDHSSFPFALIGPLYEMRSDRKQSEKIINHYIELDVAFAAKSIAPIRSKPERTYDFVTESFQPNGEHIPIVLSKLLNLSASGKEKGDLAKAIMDFGNESGLFHSIAVSRLGRTNTSPFQVLAQMGSMKVNIVDVGYGISQSLPVVVESALLDRRRYLLLQQPEVHLHPKAQAALGTFFAKLAGKRQGRYIIETHSDYILDRIRLEIANKTISKKDVCLLYFQKKGYYTSVSEIGLDEQGNITKTPPGYRDFFLREELKLLTRGDVS